MTNGVGAWICVSSTILIIDWRSRSIMEAEGATLFDLPLEHTSFQKDEHLILSVPARLERSGKEMKMLIEGEAERMEGPDPALVWLIARAHSLREKLITGGGASLREIARRERVESSYFTRIIRLTFLSPYITKAILDGRQPPMLTPSRLMRDTRFPLDWKEQREVLGFT